MRDVIPYIFWPWFGISCFILLRRRFGSGSWRAQRTDEATDPVDFPPLAADPLPAPSVIERSTFATAAEPATVTAAPPVHTERPRSRSLAEAVDGIVMPCDLAPLMGSGTIDPREVAFFAHGAQPGEVGAALADELERLGYEITPLDDRSIRARRGPDLVEARLFGAEITPPEVLHDRHPSAPEDAVVVELKLA